MKPLQRKFVMPADAHHRPRLSMDHGAEQVGSSMYAHLGNECEVRVMDAYEGRIAWNNSVSSLENAFLETAPMPL